MDVFSLLKFWRNNTQITKDFDSSVDDEESFFDLVFTSKADENENENENENVCSFDFSSPDLMNFNNKNRVLPLGSPNTKTHQSPQMLQTIQSPLRMLKLGFKTKHGTKPDNENAQNSSFKADEMKIGALLKRDNSLRHQLMNEKLLERDHVSSKRFSKEVVSKYLNLMKVSKRSNEKSRLSDSSVTPSSSPVSSVFSPRKDYKKSGGRMVLRDVRKHLGKSRSSLEILRSPARKSDDSVLQQDGIQGAILHCKRSFDSHSQDYFLSRSGSAPVNDQARVLIEQNRSSI